MNYEFLWVTIAKYEGISVCDRKRERERGRESRVIGREKSYPITMLMMMMMMIYLLFLQIYFSKNL